MRKYFLFSIFFIIVITSFSLFYLSFYGIKTNKFNDLIDKKIKEIEPRFSLKLNDVFLKINIKDKSLKINTIDPKIYIENYYIDLSDVNINLDIIKYINKSNSIKKIQINSKENSIKNITDFINAYKFNMPLFIVYNQIKSGSVKAMVNLYPSGSEKNNFKYVVIGKVKNTNINIFNKNKIDNLNFNFHVKDEKLELKNINLIYEDIVLESKKVSITKQNEIFNIEGNFKNQKTLINPEFIFKFANLKTDILDKKKILIESDNNFSFKINKDRKIKNLIYNSKLNFDEVFINKKYQDLIFLKNGIIDTKYTDKNLEIDIDSDYYFLKDKYNNKSVNNNLSIKLKKLNGKELKIESNIKNEKVKLSSKDIFKYFNINQNLVKEQDILLGTSSKIKFILSKNNKIKNLNINSIIDFDKIKIDYISKRLNEIIPDYNNKVFLLSDNLELNYSKNKLQVKGKGKYSLKDKFDDFEINFTKNKDNINFNSIIELTTSPVEIRAIDYKKGKNIKSIVNIEGTYNKNKTIKLKNINLLENNNKMEIKNLNISKNNKIKDISQLELNYLNTNKNINNLKISKKKNKYKLTSNNLDGNDLVKNLLKGDSRSSFLKIFNNLNSEIDLNLDKLAIDDQSNLNKVRGKIIVKNNIIHSAKIEAKLNKRNKFLLNIKTTPKQEKITNLYIEKPSPFIKNYKFIKGFEEGSLSYDSIEKNGLSKSKLKIYDFKVKEVPILAKLLTLASLQGIADLLTGEGIRFDELDMDYESTKTYTTVKELYVIGPAISILMNGYIEKDKLTSLKGTLVPATTINKTISKIPLVGNILVGKKVGEGVFGVSFKIKGHPKKLKTTVNPIKTLTPRFITRTIEKLKKN